jgi:hypothetical protein
VGGFVFLLKAVKKKVGNSYLLLAFFII